MDGGSTLLPETSARAGTGAVSRPGTALSAADKKRCFLQCTLYVLRFRMIQGPRHCASEGAPSVPDFDPVKLRYRRDGWTPERQRGFIRALASCGCVLEACRRLGLSTESAYRLCRHPKAASFRRAWEIAVLQARRGRLQPLRSARSPAPAPARKFAHPSTSEHPHGMCQMRQDHQLLRAAPPPAPPAYSRDAFIDMVRRQRAR